MLLQIGHQRQFELDLFFRAGQSDSSFQKHFFFEMAVVDGFVRRAISASLFGAGLIAEFFVAGRFAC
jgi:hypothetical protein